MKTYRSPHCIPFIVVLVLIQAVLLVHPAALAVAQDAPVRIIFMHHSTGGGLIWEGGARELFSALGYEFWDHGYNDEGLTDAAGNNLGINWDVPGDNTDPNGWPDIFNQPVTDPPQNTFSHMLEFDVIIFKSCFPNADIQSDEQLEEYRQYALNIRDVIDQHPDKLFIPFTIPPLVPNSTTPEAAARAKEWAAWLASPDYMDGHPNIVVFDFFSELADEDGYLRAEYRGEDEYDSHPNTRANQTVARTFVEFVDQAIHDFKPGMPSVTELGSAGAGRSAMLFEDFEASDAIDRWWILTSDEGVNAYKCEIGEGYESAQALRLVYSLREGGQADCNTNWEAGEPWTSAKGLRFYWRADQPDAVVWVVLGVHDPTQATPGMQDLTLFEVELRVAGEEWSEVTLFWDDLPKAEWLSGSGVDVLDPGQAYHLGFAVPYWESAPNGSVWIDNIGLIMGGE